MARDCEACGANGERLTKDQLLYKVLCEILKGNSSISGGATSTPVTRTPDFVEVVGTGVKNTDAGVKAVSLYFEGSGGKLNGVDVPSGTNVPYGEGGVDLLGSIPFEVPTSTGGRVLLSYVRV